MFESFESFEDFEGSECFESFESNLHTNLETVSPTVLEAFKASYSESAMCKWLSSNCFLEKWAFALSSTIFKIWKPFSENPNHQLITNGHLKPYTQPYNAWVQKNTFWHPPYSSANKNQTSKTLWHLPHFSTSMLSFYRPTFVSSNYKFALLDRSAIWCSWVPAMVFIIGLAGEWFDHLSLGHDRCGYARSSNTHCAWAGGWRNMCEFPWFLW